MKNKEKKNKSVKNKKFSKTVTKKPQVNKNKYLILQKTMKLSPCRENELPSHFIKEIVTATKVGINISLKSRGMLLWTPSNPSITDLKANVKITERKIKGVNLLIIVVDIAFQHFKASGCLI
jgi:hypothetical protein